MERTILYATDLSGDDSAGLRHASALARDRSATLAIAHVIELVAADGEPLLLKTLRLDSTVLWRRLRKLLPLRQQSRQQSDITMAAAVQLAILLLLPLPVMNPRAISRWTRDRGQQLD